jgi:hypothetical protein
MPVTKRKSLYAVVNAASDSHSLAYSSRVSSLEKELYNIGTTRFKSPIDGRYHCSFPGCSSTKSWNGSAGTNLMKLFSSSLTVEQNRLECFPWKVLQDRFCQH